MVYAVRYVVMSSMFRFRDGFSVSLRAVNSSCTAAGDERGQLVGGLWVGVGVFGLEWAYYGGWLSLVLARDWLWVLMAAGMSEARAGLTAGVGLRPTALVDSLLGAAAELAPSASHRLPENAALKQLRP